MMDFKMQTNRKYKRAIQAKQSSGGELDLTMGQLQGETEQTIPQLQIVGYVENLVNNSSTAAAMPDGAAAGLDDQKYDHYVPDHLGQEEGKELIGLKVVQALRIQQRLQYVKVIEQYEQERYGNDAQQRIGEVLLDGMADVAQQVVYVGHLLDGVLRILAYNRGNTVPLHWCADQVAQPMRIAMIVHHRMHWRQLQSAVQLNMAIQNVLQNLRKCGKTLLIY